MISLARVYVSLLSASVVLGLSIPRSGVRVLISNDDGWAEANIRAQYNVLTIAGYNVRTLDLSIGDDI